MSSFDIEDVNSLLMCYDENQKEQYLTEKLIVVNENDEELGMRTKLDCHLNHYINQGLIHRAFSVLLFNTRHELLITERSERKITYPSHISNSCCSHPLFNDEERDNDNAIGVKRAAIRKMKSELGIKNISTDDLVVMTRFIYKTSFDQFWGEHELTYILVCVKDFELEPDQNEIKSFRYVSKEELKNYTGKNLNYISWYS